MKPPVLFLLLCFASGLPAGEEPKSHPKMTEPVMGGSISLPEISAAVSVGNLLLIAADDPESKDNQFHMIALLTDPVARLRSNHKVIVGPAEQIYEQLLRTLPGHQLDQPPDPKTIKDLEDATASPQGDIFLITSHSRNKNNKTQLERQRLVRLRLRKDTAKVENVALTTDSRLLEALPKELAESTQRRPGAKNAEGKYDPGFNIEGLAWEPEGNLLIGVRSPTLGSTAIVLRLSTVNKVFDRPTDPIGLTIAAKLELGGLGIRGMCYDPERKGYWIIAGLAEDPDEGDPPVKNDWSVWFWNGRAATPELELKKKWRRADLPIGVKLENPEAVSLLKKENEKTAQYLLLISDDGGGEPSTYVVIPLAMFR